MCRHCYLQQRRYDKLRMKRQQRQHALYAIRLQVLTNDKKNMMPKVPK
jgi:hypothetical protein